MNAAATPMPAGTGAVAQGTVVPANADSPLAIPKTALTALGLQLASPSTVSREVRERLTQTGGTILLANQWTGQGSVVYLGDERYRFPSADKAQKFLEESAKTFEHDLAEEQDAKMQVSRLNSNLGLGDSEIVWMGTATKGKTTNGVYAAIFRQGAMVGTVEVLTAKPISSDTVLNLFKAAALAARS